MAKRDRGTTSNDFCATHIPSHTNLCANHSSRIRRAACFANDSQRDPYFVIQWPINP